MRPVPSRWEPVLPPPWISRVLTGGLRVGAFGVAVFLMLSGACGPAMAASRTQSIALSAGWNAVQIAVQPTNAALIDLFQGRPIEVVATYLRPSGPAQFIQNPDEIEWSRSGWAVWYAAGREDHALSTLHTLQSHRAYLIRCRTGVTLELEGEVEHRPIQWPPNAFHLVGFDVDPDNPPDFASFFGGSSAHRNEAMFRLLEGLWTPVQGAEKVHSGEAYWIYTRGASDFQGPLVLELPFGRVLDFSDFGSAAEVRLRNAGPTPMASIRIERHPATAGSPPALPLSLVIRDPETLAPSYPPLPDPFLLSALAPGATERLDLHLRRRDLSGPASALFRITGSTGARAWLPVSARD